MKRTHQLLSMGFSLLIMVLLMTGCTKDEGLTPDNQVSDRGFTTAGSGKTVNFYALSDRNEILRYKAGPPASLVSTMPILGLGATERILAIDYRPSTATMYGVSDSSKIYIIDPGSGLTKPVSRTPFEPTIKGTSVGFDFDTYTDKIRLVTDQGQNLNIDPDQGFVISVDVDLNPAGSAINAVAFSRAFTPSRVFPMYDIDVARGSLFKQDPATGVLSVVGSLGLVISGEGGFDIGGSNNTHIILQNQTEVGYAVLYGHALTGGLIGNDDQSTDAYRIYEVNLTNGRTTYKGVFDRNVIGIAIP